MATDAREIVDQHRDRPVHEVGRILVEQGHCNTNYLRPAQCISAYWQHQRARIERGELIRGCDGPCQPWTNNAGRVMCSHSGLICAGHCDHLPVAEKAES
jgi:hypothetical protein